jgi:DNA/RNA-binding domain of Phe-tRNA-synthetase-like protein
MEYRHGQGAEQHTLRGGTMTDEVSLFQVSEAWRSAFPGAHAGVLVMRGVRNPEHHDELDARKCALQDELRSRYAGLDRRAIQALPAIQAYNAYYKRFGKTYHVQLQLESIAFKGKEIPTVAALVECMFMAEVKNMLLTAGHDLDTVQVPATLHVSDGSESYTLLRGQEQVLKPGDMMISDAAGMISSVLYGPDQRTQIRPGTQSVLFTVYAPQGISPDTVKDHLTDIRDNILLVSPGAIEEMLHIFAA